MSSRTSAASRARGPARARKYFVLSVLLLPVLVVFAWLLYDGDWRQSILAFSAARACSCGESAPTKSSEPSQTRPTADLGCATVSAPTFDRVLCFSGFSEKPGTVYGGHIAATILLTITKQEKTDGALVGDSTAAACGDSLHIRFLSTRALFAPVGTKEISCGTHELELILPKDAKTFAPDVWLVHIDGQGLAEPDPPRPSPAQLSSYNDGPSYYNVRADFSGRLVLPDWYVADALDIQRGGPQPFSAETWRAPALKMKDENTLPVCDSQDRPGRWVFQTSLYPEVPGEPLVWRPFGCHHNYYTGPALNKCFNHLQRVKFIGESTLGESFAQFQIHLNKSNYYWPEKQRKFATKAVYAKPSMLRAQGLNGEFHGWNRVEEWAINELTEWPVEHMVILQGANDAARDRLEMFEIKMRRWLNNLKGNISAGLVKMPKGVVYVTCPFRQYKWSGHPGRAVCPDGAHNYATCQHTMGGADDYRYVNGEMQWEYGTINAAVHLFFGTIDRRRRVNQVAKRVIREFFPDARVVDYEHITEALPSDYSIDGEHWGCRTDIWMGQRDQSPYQCKGLANVVVSNLIANALCNDRGVEYRRGARLDWT